MTIAFRARVMNCELPLSDNVIHITRLSIFGLNNWDKHIDAHCEVTAFKTIFDKYACILCQWVIFQDQFNPDYVHLNGLVIWFQPQSFLRE